MKYPLSEKYDIEFVRENMMGPNPLKLLEEMLEHYCPAVGSLVLDLGCGRGMTSIMMAGDLGLRVFATDLWISASANKKRFDEFNLHFPQITPIHADAHSLPFANDFFDAVISIDAYHYFGCNAEYMDKHLLPIVKNGGYILFVVPGIRENTNEDILKQIMITWGPSSLQYFRTPKYWRETLESAEGVEVIAVTEMQSFTEVWDDWLDSKNPYALEDEKCIRGETAKYMNFIGVVARKK